MSDRSTLLVLIIALAVVFPASALLSSGGAGTQSFSPSFDIKPEKKIDPSIRPQIPDGGLVDVYVETLDPHSLGEYLRSHGFYTPIGLRETKLDFPIFLRIQVPASLIDGIASLPSTGYIISYQRPKLLDFVDPKLGINRIEEVGTPRPTGQWSAFYHGAMEAWEEYGDIAMGKNVTIAILDSGIDFSQADLQWTWKNYSNPDSPYNGLPEVFDSSSLITWLLYGSAFPQARGSWFSDTSITVSDDDGDGYIEVNGYSYYVGNIPTASGVYHFGYHPDEFLNAYYNQTLGIPWNSKMAPVAVLVTDAHTPGVYDTVYVDLDADFNFTDEKPATRDNPMVYKDVYDHVNDTYDFDHWDHGDGYPDISGGIVAFIADGRTPLPYSERASQLLGVDNRIPGNGDLVFFFGELGMYGTGHGTMCASSAAGRGKTAGYKIGMAPKAKLIGIRLFGPAEDIYMSWLFAVEGFDGAPMTGDEPDITSNSYGYSAIHWDGWDEHDKYLDFLLHDYAQDSVLFFIAAGNGGPGYGTITTPDPRSSVGVGASIIFKPYAYLRNIGNWEYAMEDDPIGFSARGPTSNGLNGISLMANGFADWEAVAPNIIIYYYGEFTGGYGWLMWGTGTSHASPTAAGAAADILSAFVAKYGYKPKASVLKALVMQSTKDIYMDPFTQGTGIVDVAKGVELVMKGGIFSEKSEWNPGTFNGTHYQFFTNLMLPGDSYSEEFELNSLYTENDTEVHLSGLINVKTKSVTVSHTTVSSDDDLMIIVNKTGYMIYPYVQQLIDPDAEMIRIDAYYPYNYFDNGTDYVADSDYDLWTLAWHDDGDGVISDQEWGVWSLSTNFGPTERVVLWKPLQRLDDGDNSTKDYLIIWFRPYQGMAGVPLNVKVESFKRTYWDWVSNSTATVPAGGSADILAEITVPDDTPPGIYEGFLNFSYNSHYFLVPVTVDVPATSLPFKVEKNDVDDLLPYQNDKIGGFTDWGWREEIGDWRFVFVMAPKPEDARSIAFVKWVSNYTDVDLLVLGKRAFSFKYIGNPPSSEFGDYTLDVIAQSQDTFTEAPGYVYYRKQSTGPTSQFVAFQHPGGLLELIFHKVVPGGQSNEEPISFGVADVYGMPSQLKFVFDERPGNITTRGYFNITMTPDMDLPKPVVGSFGPAKRLEKYFQNLVIHQDNVQGISSMEDFIRALANGDYTYLLNVSGYEAGGRLFVHITSPDCPDLDLGLFYDLNGDHKAEPNELVAYNADEDADEKVELYNPPDGTYIIKVLGYNVPNNLGHFNLYILLEQQLKPFQVVSAPQGPMRAGQTYRVTMYFDLLPAEGSYGGWVSIGFFNDSKVLKTDIVIKMIDHVPPRVIPISPKPDSVLGPGTVHIEFICDDNLFGMKLSRMLATLDLAPLSHLSQTSNGSWYQDVQVTEGGTHTITVEAWDWKDQYTRVSWSFYVDASPPEIQLITPTEGAVASTNDVRITFHVQDESLKHVTATIAGPSNITLVDQDTPENAFDYNGTTTLPDGLYILNVTATDAVGNSVSRASQFYVDTSAPDISVESPQDGAWTKEGSVTLSFSVDDLTLSSVKVNGETVFSSSFPFESHFEYSTTIQLSEGSNSITIVAEDAAGHTTTTSITVNRDSTPPVVTITAPEETRNKELTVSVNVQDQLSGVQYVLVLLNGELVGNYTASGTSFTKDVTLTLQKGENQLQVVAVDALGNSRTDSKTIVYKPFNLLFIIAIIVIIAGFVIGFLVGLRKK